MQQIEIEYIKQRTGHIERCQEVIVRVLGLKHDADDARTEKLGPACQFAVALIARYEKHVDETNAHDDIDKV